MRRKLSILALGERSCYARARMSDAYRTSGVNIDEGNRFVDRIRSFVERTHSPAVLGGIGSFAGFFRPDLTSLQDPVLTASTDGVGTKLKLAIELDCYDTIGQDLVAMSVNDLVCSGSRPLFFLDYFATGKLSADHHVSIVRGIAKACEGVGCALLGGETAEMPGMYHGKDLDLAGFAVGIVDRSQIIDGRHIQVGDAIIGIASSGFHSNGYSLVRKIVNDRKLSLTQPPPGMNEPLGDLLLKPTHLYSPLVLDLLSSFEIRGIAHITGGGFWDNIPRILPKNVQAVIDVHSWPRPPLMTFFQEQGGIDDREMLRVFNCGIGMALVVPAEKSSTVIQQMKVKKFAAWKIGVIEKRTSETGITVSF